MTIPDFLAREADGFVHVKGHRVGLNHIVRPYREGYSPEMLREHLPTLDLPTIHKVIAFYLENEQEVDAMIAVDDAEIERRAAAARRGPDTAELRRRADARRRAEAL